ALVPAEPGLNLGMLVGGVVVDDQVELPPGRGLAVDLVEKADEFLMPMARHALADDLAVEHVERGEQRRCAVPLVVMRHRPATARPVQCVLPPGGSASVISTTRSITAAVSGGLPAGRVASCNKPSTPSAIKRACQRQIVGLPLPVCRWIAIVPTPSALSSTIR